MLRECLARRPRAAAVGSLVLSTVLVAGISAACEKSQAAIDEAPASTGSLPAEPPTGPLCTVKDSRSAKQFPRLAYPPRVGRTDGDERPRTKPLSRLAGRISRPAAQAEDIARLAAEDLAAEGSEPTTPEPSPALVLSDPFNAAATAAVETHRAADAESIDDYLFEAYRRLPLKRDATGDFTWKDLAAAARMELSLKAYVIGGMDPDFKELVYAAGKRMDAAGIQWSILAAFRDDWRQQIASGFKASAQNSCHGGSRAVGGYGNGRCVDMWTAAGPVEELFAWLDRAGAVMGLARPMPSRDPAHVQPVGDWRGIAKQLRAARLKTPMIATVRRLIGADTAAGLTELATTTNPPIGLAATMPASEGQPLPGYAATRPRLILAAAKSPAVVGAHAALSVHKVRRKLASAATATRQQGRTRLSAAIRNSKRI